MENEVFRGLAERDKMMYNMSKDRAVLYRPILLQANAFGDDAVKWRKVRSTSA